MTCSAAAEFGEKGIRVSKGATTDRIKTVAASL
jgi:hypothetical protein